MLKDLIISEYSILSLDDLHFADEYVLQERRKLRCHNPEEPMAVFEVIIALVWDDVCFLFRLQVNKKTSQPVYR